MYCIHFFSQRKYFVIFVVLSVLSRTVSFHRCNSLKRVRGRFITKNGLIFQKTINGCIDRKKFHGKIIVQADLSNQYIKIIGKDAVRNIIHLSNISFSGCNTEKILPGAFRNVFGLKIVHMSYCKLKEIPKGVFNEIPQLEVLNLDFNEIDLIENEAFTNLTALKRVNFLSNKLEYWNREWFGDSKGLEILDFRFNKIRTIPRKAFESLSKLKTLYFDVNEIQTIHVDAFKGVPYLDYLGLRNNRLKEIKEDIFPNKLKISTLDISTNYLNYISNEVLKKISVKEILIECNPWKCSCLDSIYYWIHTSNATLQNKEMRGRGMIAPVCAVPEGSSQSCLEFVDDELTKRYLTALRNMPKDSENDGCARFEEIHSEGWDL